MFFIHYRSKMQFLIRFLFLYFMINGLAWTQQPYSSYWFPEELLQWEPATDKDAPFNRGSIKLADRFLNPGQKANPNARDEAKIVALSIMYPTTSANPSQGSGTIDVYAFGYWQYIDLLVMWGGSAGEGIIVPPASDVIDAGHKNGVLVLGTIFFPPAEYGGKFEWVEQLLQTDSEGKFPVADQLLRVAAYYGFDGWFINQETKGGNWQTALKMQEFLKYLQANKPAHMHIMWYDAMNKDGQVIWQDCLNENNEMFFEANGKVADSLFIDFGWASLETSRDKAVSLGRSPYELFSGINVQEHGYHAQKFDWEDIFPAALPHRTSLGMYCPNFAFTKASNREQYYALANRYWVGANRDPSRTTTPIPNTDWHGIAHYIPAKSVINDLPFVTHFNTGHGYFFAVQGEKLKKSEWNNRSLQDILPTWRWIAQSPATALQPEFDFTEAWYGGTSLKISGHLQACTPTYVKLYQTNLKVKKDTRFSLIYKTNQEKGRLSRAKVALTFAGLTGKRYFNVGKIQTQEWNEKWFSLKKYAGHRITSLGFEFESSSDIDNYVINMGQIAVFSVKKAKKTCVKRVSDFQINTIVFNEDEKAQIRLKWKHTGKNVQSFNIYRIGPDGKRYFLGSTPNTVYYVSNLVRINKELKTNLEVVPLSHYDREDQKSKAKCQFTWPPPPLPGASFLVSSTIAAPGKTIQLTDSSKAANQWQWSFPGAMPDSSTAQNPQVVYQTAGDYTVSLQVTNDAGSDHLTREGLIHITAMPVEKMSHLKPVAADSFVNSLETPEKAVDGKITDNSKWCAVGPDQHWIRVDLGTEYLIGKVVIKHAGAGGEAADFNTRDFQILVSRDDTSWTESMHVTDNSANISEHNFKPVLARYVKLLIIKPCQGADTAARIYEFEVWGVTE